MYVSPLRSLLVGAAAIAAILSSAQAFAQRGILGRALQGVEQEGARRSQPAQPQFRADQPQTQGALLMPGGLKRLQPQGTLQIVPGAIQPLGGERVPYSLPRNQPGAGWSPPQAGGFDFGRDLLSPMAQGMGTGQPAGATRPPGYDISRPGAGWSSPSGTWSPGGVRTPADGGASYSSPPTYYPGELSAAQPAGTPASSPKSIPEPAYQDGPVPAAYVQLPPNPIHLSGRPITEQEIAAANGIFGARFRELAQQLETQLQGAFLDQQQLVAELSAKSIAADTQIRILEAIRNGDAIQAQVYFAAEAKDLGRAATLYHQVNTEQAVKSLAAKAGSGKISSYDVHDARKAVDQLGSAVPNRQAASATLEEMDRQVAMYEAVKDAVAGDAGARVQLPGGTVPIIRNPKLPVGAAVALGNGTILVGTGGGELELVRDTAAHAMGLPMASGLAMPDFSGEEIHEGVFLVNPPGSGGEVQYQIHGQAYTLQPGFTQHLPGGDTWEVQFLRGQQHGWQTYGLTPGTYHFQQTERGWELYSQEFTLAIDNTENRQPFAYLLGGEPREVAPGQKNSHKSTYPLVIAFDRGNGVAAKQIRVMGGTLRVAISAADNMWDLFDASQKHEPGGFVPAF